MAAGEAARRGLPAAGRECAATLVKVLDALGKEGEAEVEAGAYRLRAALGVATGAVARGALAARALVERAAGRRPRSPPPQPPPARAARHTSPTRVTPPRTARGTSTTVAVSAEAESPLSLEIRRLTEARDAARAARAAAAAAGR
eukprot:4386420-Pleurochrysis_carterae.AAC.1